MVSLLADILPTSLLILAGKSYGCIHFLSVTSMCVGLVLFILADTQVQPNFDGYGELSCVCVSVCVHACMRVRVKGIKCLS